jgi:pimeloyl-ACP methyl ester carboxylesterase
MINTFVRRYYPCMVLIILLIASVTVTLVSAATITPVDNNDSGALELAKAIVSDQSTLISARFMHVPSAGTPNGKADSLSFFSTMGDSFAILTTGDVRIADSDNNSESSGINLGASTPSNRGTTAYDVTTLDLQLSAPSGVNCLLFDFAFYSEEYAEFVGSVYNDAFIAELDKSTWVANTTIYAPDNFAYDPDGNVISINSTGFTQMSGLNAAGTTYDGSTVLLQAATIITPGMHNLYLSIFDQGDHIYDSAVFIDNVRFETVNNPDKNCKPGAQEKVHVPLIIIPGVTGSKLNNIDGEVWPNIQELVDSADDDFLFPLRFGKDGISPLYDTNAYNSIEVGEIITNEIVKVSIFSTTVDIYGTTLNTFIDQGKYIKNKDLFVFPYDWRRNINSSATLLLDYIDQVRAETGSDKVNILAHSMGGNLTRAVLANPGSVGKINRVITLGTPVLGSTKMFGALEFQDPCFIEKPLLGCIVNKSTLQELATNMPAIYQLLPSPTFHTAIGSPYIINWDVDNNGKNEGAQSYAQWIGKVANNRNSLLTPLNKEFHNAFDYLTFADPSVIYVSVVGDSKATVDSIIEYQNCGFLGWFECKVAYQLHKGNGDETVPLHSADLFNPNKAFDYRNGIIVAYAHGVDHGELPKNSKVLNFAISFFGATPTIKQHEAMIISRDMKTSRDQVNIAAGYDKIGEVLALAGESELDSLPQSFSGIEMETLGPLTGFFRDPDGNLLGIHPDMPDIIWKQIPSGSYDAVGDTITFFFNEDGTFSGQLNINDDDQIRLRVRSYEEDKITAQAVINLDTVTDAVISIDLTNGMDLSTVLARVDLDGDGITDREIPPESIVIGDAANDIMPPKTVFELKWNAPEIGGVSLSAQDNWDGSGIASTYFIVEDDSMTPIKYQQPFDVTLGVKLRYMSVDNAGNTEGLQSIQTVPLDILPGRYPNTLFPGKNDFIPVAILSTDHFDATQVNPNSLKFANAPIVRRANGKLMVNVKDLNKDGKLDLVAYFYGKYASLSTNSSYATLRGYTYSNELVIGVDSVKVKSGRNFGFDSLNNKEKPASTAPMLDTLPRLNHSQYQTVYR